MESELIDSFGIDDGELDNLTLPEAFVLGVEWAMIQFKIFEGEPFECYMHPDNSTRVKNLLERHGKSSVATWFNDDWMWLVVW